MTTNQTDGDLIPISVADTCRILAKCKNRYGNKDPRLTEANDRMAFATINDGKNIGNKKKRINLLQV